MLGLRDERDTIAAIATGAGAGGIGVIRLSGDRAFAISEQITAASPPAREARFVHMRDRTGATLDQGILIHFPGPHSFTGEDVAELQCHGGPIILRALLRECIAAGARQAEPGEFSQRAFINGKIDLVQAEAIADLINSSTEAAARSASRSLTGHFSSRINALFEQLVRLRVFVEAAIDFPEEEIDFIADSDVQEKLRQLEDNLEQLLASARRGRTLREGMKLVIAGAPNAGKSSLLNQLAEQDSAIVTDIPGTTRDVLREYIQIAGLPLHIVDTAGLRESPDTVEQEGIRRARLEMQNADRILLVSDCSASNGQLRADSIIARHRQDLPANTPLTLVHNKCDLSGCAPRVHGDGALVEIWLSAKTGAGLELLREHLLDCAGLGEAQDSDFSARERHVRALEDCLGQLRRGRQQLQHHGAAELIADDLRYAQEYLGSVTGQFSSDDLLGEIFGSFCIGK